MGNSTNANNLSTIDAMSIGPDGSLHLDVTWAIGEPDPFNPDIQNFPRIGLTLFTNNDDGGLGRLISPRDGVRWIIKSDLALQNAQPFQQTPPNWTFYESNYQQPIPAGMVATNATLDYDAAQNFSGLMPANIVHPDGMGQVRANALGIQIVGPSGLVVGQTVKGHIWLCGVPEPASAMLLAFGAVALAGNLRRRQS